MRVELIGYLCNGNFKILKIYENESDPEDLKKYSWWVVDNWKPFNDSGEEGETFSQIRGLEITDFINRNHIVQSEQEFLSRFNKFIENLPTMVCDFHKDFKWKLYYESR